MLELLSLLALALSCSPSFVSSRPQALAAASASSSSSQASPASSTSLLSSSSSRENANSTSAIATVALGTRARFGLKQDGMQVNSIYIGFLVDYSRETPIDINRQLGAPMSIIGDYIDFYQDDMEMRQIDWHLPAIRRAGGGSVYAPALRPRFSLDKWTDEMSQILAQKLAGLNKQGLVVWCRFAWEMNGGWFAYGNQPEAYIRAFRSVSNAIKATTNSTYLVWAPNVRYGETQSQAGYEPYYPGQQYVDIAGLSLYAPGETGTKPDSGAFVKAMSSFYRLYGKSHPIIVAETSAPYAYAVPSNMQYCDDCDIQGNLPNVSNLASIPTNAASEYDIKVGWLRQLVSDEAAGRYPNLTAVCFFNYFKYGSSHSNEAPTLIDFRAVGGHAETEAAFRQIVGNVSAYQGGYTGFASRSASLSFLLSALLVLISISLRTL